MLTSVAVSKNESLVEYFSSSFHASAATLGPIEAATEASNINTANDVEATPLGKQWFLPGSSYGIAEVEPAIPISSVLLCSKCSDNNPCSFDNACVSGKCQCVNGEQGSLCQM